MTLLLFKRTLVVLAFSLSFNFNLAAEDNPSLANQVAAKNVVLIIGDGMDDHQITIARNYLKGVRGRLVLDDMPVRGSVQVLTVDENDPSIPLFVADSANSATAMATGVVTSRGRIATSANKDEDLQTIVELAHAAGYKTGIVTTSAVTDATPAAFAAHINIRFCESPDAMKTERRGIVIDCSDDKKVNGGKGSISEQLVNSDLDVLLGGGRKNFIQKSEDSDQTIEDIATANGFQLVHTAAELDSARPDKILGLFADSHLPVRLQGEDGRSGEKPIPSIMNMAHWSQGEVELPAAMNCEDNPDYKQTPSIKTMTKKALEVLNYDNDKGFFLMIESASIDKQSHVRKACGSIGELAQLDETLAYVLEFASRHPNTLVMVTADHGQAAQLIPSPTLYKALGIPVYTPGHMVRINMPGGGTMGVNYATNDFFSEEHTGVAVPIYANEVGRPWIKTLMTQPEIFNVTRAYLGL